MKDAWWLARKEFRFYKISIGFSVVVTILLAALISFSLEQSDSNVFHPEGSKDKFIFMDIIFVLVTPSLSAIFMSGPYLSLKAVKEDPFSKRMAYLRSLPIPVNVLSLSRTIMMLMTFTLLSLVFYATFTFVLYDQIFEHLTVAEYFTFLVIWLGYAAAMGGFNPFIEYGTNGKVLHTVPYLLMILLAFVIFVFYQLAGNGIVESTISLSTTIGWPIALLFLFVGAAGCVGWNKLLTVRLARRDYV
ncbi:hypothetical protein [Bacillus salacetis]|nr:hypothetical protein [Bacillus salacetis]